MLDGYVRKVILERRTAVYEKTTRELEKRKQYENIVSWLFAQVPAAYMVVSPSPSPSPSSSPPPPLPHPLHTPQIKRPYFHVKPLERAQLKNWMDYLDFEISEGNSQRIYVLFERCMIACALYEDFWSKVSGDVSEVAWIDLPPLSLVLSLC